MRDFDPIGLVADLPLALVVHPSVPATTLKGLVEHAKANPDALGHMSAGSGTLSHLMMEDFKQRAGIRILHVPYKGSPPALVDLIGGTVQVDLDTVVVTQPHVRSGKLRLLAVGTRERLPVFPDAPTIAESGYPGFEAVAWIALAAPKGTPRELRERINADVAAARQHGRRVRHVPRGRAAALEGDRRADRREGGVSGASIRSRCRYRAGPSGCRPVGPSRRS